MRLAACGGAGMLLAAIVLSLHFCRSTGDSSAETGNKTAANEHYVAKRPSPAPPQASIESRPASVPVRKGAGHTAGRGSPSPTASSLPSPAPVKKAKKAKGEGIASSPGKYSFADMTFSNHADVVLGNLLTMEYGDDLLGDPDEAYSGFAEAFDRALEYPIDISEDDDDFQRELKEGVIEMREELARRRLAGENIEEILSDTWRQMKELGLFRKDVDSQVEGQLDDGMTQEDYENLVGEANRILAEEGIKPLELPATLKRALRLRRLQARDSE